MKRSRAEIRSAQIKKAILKMEQLSAPLLFNPAQPSFILLCCADPSWQAAERRANHHTQSRFTRKVKWEAERKRRNPSEEDSPGQKWLFLIAAPLTSGNIHRRRTAITDIRAMSWRLVVFQLELALIFHIPLWLQRFHLCTAMTVATMLF